jgi:hypothetical protein
MLQTGCYADDRQYDVAGEPELRWPISVVEYTALGFMGLQWHPSRAYLDYLCMDND